jgi:hypothetical protein
MYLMPGDEVEVRSLDEILATLDSSGALDGVPFMPEMAAFCERRATVLRRVHKLNDWVHGTGLTRIDDVVQLDIARCTGSAHGGCQSNCRIRWKEAWLRQPSGRASARPSVSRPSLSHVDLVRLAKRTNGDTQPVYTCQATELTRGGRSISWNDPRHYLRDLLGGNIRPIAWLDGVALALFNWTQRRRGGVTFPYIQRGTSPASPSGSLGLRVGDWVRVKTKAQIEATLNNKQRNRGLWFDGEMLRHCGGEYRVSAVLDHVIIESTGVLKQLTIPCVVLDGVRATGEYLAFNPEDEHIFWREIWLERLKSPMDDIGTGWSATRVRPEAVLVPERRS